MGQITDAQLVQKWTSLRQSAKSRNIKFTISLNKLRRLMNQKTCFFTKVAFGIGDSAMSIDRIDTNAGYSDDNVVACTIKINSLKANLTEEVITQLYKGIVKFRK